MKRILVIDDEPEIIDLIKNRLEANCYEVISAMDGQEGIEKAKNEFPDLIMMDIIMPNLRGGEAVKYLQDINETKNIPVMFLTAVASKHPTDQEREGINVDGKMYRALAKPFNPDDLLSIVRDLIGYE